MYKLLKLYNYTYYSNKCFNEYKDKTDPPRTFYKDKIFRFFKLPYTHVLFYRITKNINKISTRDKIKLAIYTLNIDRQIHLLKTEG